MASYQITSSAGADMGVYEGATAREAVEAMWADAGVEGSDALFAELTVRETLDAAEITDEQIEALRQSAYSAGDMVQVAICEIALGDDDAAEMLYEEHPYLRGKVESLGVIAEHIDADVCAKALCARAIAEGRAAHEDRA